MVVLEPKRILNLESGCRSGAIASMPISTLTTLGRFTLSVDGNSTPGPATRKARALMAFLVMNRNADTARERLLEMFWPDVDPERARNSLNTALHSIRRCLRTAGLESDQFIRVTRSIIRWAADTAADTEEFTKLAARVEDAANREALQLYYGDFLEGDFDDWTVSERERFAAVYESVLARVVRSSRDTDAALRFISRNPYDEEAYAALVEGDLAADKHASAALWVERCRKALSEVGEKPSAAFEARFGSIVHVEPAVTDELTLPFTGRDAELAVLAAKFKDAEAGRGSITLVHGEAGVGKSTLLKRSANISAENNLRVLEIKCSSEIPNAFGPWESVFNSVGAGDFDTFVRTHASDLAGAVGQAITAQLTEPTVLIIDDVHELTGDALEMFVALAKQTRPRHAVIAAIRPEGVAQLRSRLADATLQEMPIGGLDHADLRRALTQSLGGEHTDVLDVLYSRTGGHPLFFNGLLNSLVLTGAIARDGRGWRSIKTIGHDIKLPDTLKRFIEVRLRTRGDTPRAIACALALEPAATADDLTAALAMDDAAVLDALDDLLALGLITQPDTGVQFAFTHELIREVAATGLNAGRRAAIHRAFAQRLMKNEELEASLRLARHLEAAGERLAAARAYLRSAEEALELNAAQDASVRCGAGIMAAVNLERTGGRDILLTRLNRTAARAALAHGDVDEALARARSAVASSRSGGDIRESTQTLIDLAAIEGAAFLLSAQKADAEAAVQSAGLCADEALAAQALVLQASAARELGLRDEALQVSLAGRELALKHNRVDVAQSALEEILRSQMTWWLFNDALQTAGTALDSARREGPLAEAVLLQARCGLAYMLDRFDEAKSHLQTAIRITNETVAPRNGAVGVPIQPLPMLQFACYYMTAKIAAARNEWSHTLDAVQQAAKLTSVARLPRHKEALTLLRIDAMLQRNGEGDDKAAYDLVCTLADSTPEQGLIGWSDCVELARARIAARMRESTADVLLRRALNTLEENAHRALLDSDRAFSRLEEAASECGSTRIAAAARARSKYFRSNRMAAAGAAWGG